MLSDRDEENQAIPTKGSATEENQAPEAAREPASADWSTQPSASSVSEGARGLCASKWAKVGIPLYVIVAVGLGVGLGVGLRDRPGGRDTAGSTSSSDVVDGEEVTTTTALPNGEWGALALTTTTTTVVATSAPDTSSTQIAPPSTSLSAYLVTTESAMVPSENSSATNAGETTVLPSSEGGNDLSRSQIYSSSDAASSSGGIDDVRSDELLPWSFRSFSSQVIGGYGGCEDMRLDLTSAANFLVRNVIRRNAERWDEGGGFPTPHIETVAVDATAESAESEASESAKQDFAGSDSGGGETDYATNVQVEGVDEADVVKSDGAYVYAAYGDTIVMWVAATGEKISETVMAIPDDALGKEGGCVYPYSESAGGDGGAEGNASSSTTASANGTSKAEDDAASVMKSIMIDGPCFYRPRATISGMLLHGNRLVAFVQGYEPYYYHWRTPSEDRPILSGYGSTRIKVYDTSRFVNVTHEREDGTAVVVRTEMAQVSERELPGSFRNGRAIGSRVHAVTVSDVDTWNHLDMHLGRYDERYQGMDRDAYIEAATTHAAETVVPKFVDKLVLEIQEHHGEDGGSCGDIAQLAVFQTGDASPAEHGWWYDRGILGGLAEVSSFDLSVDPPAAKEGEPAVLPAKMSTAFVPNSWSTNIYATADRLFLAATGYDQNETMGYIESTFIYAYRLPAGTEGTVAEAAEAVGVGKVPGTLLNQYSMDFWDGHLRVATSTPEKWGCVDANGKEVGDPWRTGIKCEYRILRGPHNQVTVLSMPLGEGDEGYVSGGEGGGLLSVRGQTGHLGKPDETIFAVRYVGNTGFVVTFERIDPFLVLDLEDHTNPRVIGELEIPGFSNYLHPTGDGSDTLLAVGQDVDPDTGRQTGLQISMFGFSDRTKPRLLARTSAKKDGGNKSWSSSQVQWDPKAFRYLRQSKMVLLPATTYGRWTYDEATGKEKWDFFDGFVFYDVDTTKNSESITERFRVNMAEDDYSGRCYGNGYMPSRSLVFSGDATLIKGHGARSHRLESEALRWKLDFDENQPKDQCWGYWG